MTDETREPGIADERAVPPRETSLAALMDRNRTWLEGPARQTELAKVLPDGWTPARFTRIVITAMVREPKLARCSLASLWLAMIDAASMGLPLDGRLAHLVPYGQEAQLIPDYKGLIHTAYNHPRVAAFQAEAVFQKDEWRYTVGFRPHHVQNRGPRSVETLVGAYAAVTLRGSRTPIVKWMDKDEIECEHRAYSASYRNGKGPWMTHPIPMYIKSPCKEVCKFIPQSPALILALAHDDEAPERERPMGSPPVSTAVRIPKDEPTL